MTLLFIFFVFVNTPCGHWWHSQVFWLFNYVCFSKSHFKLNARNSLKSLTVSIDSEPEVEPFITQTKAALVAVQKELSENNLNLHLRVQKASKQVTISIFAPRIFRPTCMFTDKEDSGRGITTVTDKEIQSTGMKQEYHKTQRGQLHICLHGVLEFGMTVEERNTLL